jgi:hypothetical protein
MATPDTWDLAQTDAPSPPPPSAAPAAAADPTSDYIRQQLALLQAPLPSVHPDTTPAQGGIVGLLGKIGMALAGGSVTDTLSPAQRERAGIRALGDFGTSLMAGSGYYPGKPMFGGLAQGFEGASRSEAGSEQQAASYLGAQQNWQMEQQHLQLERLKEAMPLLQMQYGASIPNPLLSANTPAVPGTAGGAGKPGGGGIALGMRQNNPLNLTFAGQPGAQPGQGNPFATFSDLPSGVAATADQLALYQTRHGINTVQDAVKRWVSDPKADLTSYTADVAKALGVAPTDKIDLTNPTVQQKFILAAQPHESGGGGAVLNPADVAKGVQLAAANRGQTVQAPPAPYKVATAGATVPGPPSGSTTATADTTTTTADATPTATPAEQTFEQFQAQHPIAINAADYTVTPPGLAEAQSAMAAAKQQLTVANRKGDDAGAAKAVEAYNTANDRASKLQQDAQAKSLELQQAAQKNALDTLRQLYDAEKQRQAQAAIETQKIQAAAAEAERQRQAAERIENIKAGNTYHQQLDKESAEYAQTNTIKPMSEQALKAHQMNLSLAQLQPMLQDLPKGGGALGALLTSNPDLGWLTTAAGITDPKQTDTARLVSGLVANISTQMKPAGLGALREYEWDAFKSQLPTMLSTTDGQQKAVAILMNMNNRIQDEGNWMNNYFNRKVPDEYAKTPGGLRSAHNLDPPAGALSVQQQMDKELGPVIPQYVPPKGMPLTASGQAQWEQSLPPGKPFLRQTARPDPKNPTRALRDSSGNVVTDKTYEVRPWQ